MGFLGGSDGKEPRFNPWVGKTPWRRKWQLIQVLLPEESHEQRSLAGYSPWGHKELDMTERLTHNMASHILLTSICSQHSRQTILLMCKFGHVALLLQTLQWLLSFSLLSKNQTPYRSYKVLWSWAPGSFWNLTSYHSVPHWVPLKHTIALYVS